MSVISNKKVLVKGSPDSILENSTKIMLDWEIRDITEEDKKKNPWKIYGNGKKSSSCVSFCL